MAQRQDAKLARYPGADGGYLLSLPDGSEYEADTQIEAFSFARAEGVTRIYSAVNPSQYVLLCRED